MDSIRLFVIDDDIDEICFYNYAVRNIATGIDLSFFQNPEGLLPYLDLREDNELPHIIILDLNMPKLNGFELLAQIKSSFRYKSIPLIVSSTSANPKDRENCISVGADEYVVKPFHLTQYSSLLDRIVRRYKSGSL